MTIKKLLERATADIEILDAELLLAHALKKNREFVVAHTDESPTLFESMRFKHYVRKRKCGFATQTILGYAEFYWLNFAVNAHVFIPRPSTETLVEHAVKEILFSSPHELRDILYVDIGTGTGCIPISIKSEVDGSLKHLDVENKKLRAYAVDMSPKAIALSKKNITTHQQDITLLHGNLLAPIIDLIVHEKTSLPRHLIITANLPYLTGGEVINSPTIRREPITALVGGDDGLIFYQELLEQLKTLLGVIKKEIHDQSISLSAFFEMNPEQMSTMKKMIIEHIPLAQTTIHKDLGNIDRMVKVQFST